MRFLLFAKVFFFWQNFELESFFTGLKSRGIFHSRFSDNQSPSHTEAIVVGGFNPLDKI